MLKHGAIGRDGTRLTAATRGGWRARLSGEPQTVYL